MKLWIYSNELFGPPESFHTIINLRLYIHIIQIISNSNITHQIYPFNILQTLPFAFLEYTSITYNINLFNKQLFGSV